MVAKEGSSWKDIATRTEAIRHHGHPKEAPAKAKPKPTTERLDPKKHPK
jgi:hypothetical protein